jgi:hypothetical protein
MSCPSCEGTGRISGLGFIACELRAMHIEHPDEHRAEVIAEGSKCQTCGGTGNAPADRPESPGFTCDGCGATAVGEFWPHTNEWHKPPAWFQRSDEDGVQLACSRECIGRIAEATGKTKVVMPW